MLPPNRLTLLQIRFVNRLQNLFNDLWMQSLAGVKRDNDAASPLEVDAVTPLVSNHFEAGLNEHRLGL